MNSEKVKEIKKVLEMFAIDDKEMTLFQSPVPQGESCVKIIKYADILTLIKELESENERLKDEVKVRKGFIEDYKIVCDKKDKENKQLKNRIAELEKENQSLKESIEYGNEVCKECQSDKDKGVKWKLKQFAERLKEKATWSFIMCGDHKAGAKTVTLHDIDETLKERIEDDK